MRRFLLVAACILALGSIARAGTLYFNGFETGNTNDFYSSFSGTQGADINIVPSGGGTLGLTAPDGTHYAEITNEDDTYLPGYGESIYTDYGAPSGIPISGAFYESTKYYINVNWAAASPDDNYAGFWIDTTPNNDPGSLDESNFRIVDTGSGSIQVDGFVANPGSNGLVADITSSGWYTFKTTFQDSGGFVSNTLSVINSVGTTIGSFSGVSTLAYSDLTGTSYGDWTTVWQDGFANDVLGIDDVEVGTITGVPLPSSFWAGAGLIGLLAISKRARSVFA